MDVRTLEMLRKHAPQMAPFVEWTMQQGGTVLLAVMAYATAISDVMVGEMTVGGRRGFTYPNCWVLHDSAAALRDMAAAAGFAEAAQFCEETRLDACRLMTVVEEMLLKSGLLV